MFFQQLQTPVFHIFCLLQSHQYTQSSPGRLATIFDGLSFLFWHDSTSEVLCWVSMMCYLSEYRNKNKFVHVIIGYVAADLDDERKF